MGKINQTSPLAGMGHLGFMACAFGILCGLGYAATGASQYLLALAVIPCFFLFGLYRREKARAAQ